MAKNKAQDSREVRKAPTDHTAQLIRKKNSSDRGSAKSGKTPKGAPPTRHVDPVPESTRFINQLLPFIYFVAAILITVFFLFSKADGAVGSFGIFIRNLFCGLFGPSAFVIPALFVILAIFWKKYVDLNIVRSRVILAATALVVIASVVHVFSISAMNPLHYTWSDYGASIFGYGEPLSNWTYGVALTGGGFFGGLFGGLFRSAFGTVGAPIILIAVLVVLLFSLLGVTPGYAVDWVRYKIKQHREANAPQREERRREKREDRAVKHTIATEKRRTAAIEAQLLREEREAELEAKRAERARAAEEAQKRRSRMPDFDELIPGQTDTAPAKDEDATASADPVLITPLPDDDIKTVINEMNNMSSDAGSADTAPAETPNTSDNAQENAREPESRTLSPVREAPPKNDPYRLTEIFGASDVPADTANVADGNCVAKAPSQQNGSERSASVNAAGELEIRLAQITDNEQSDADITAPSESAAKTAERAADDYIFPPVELLHPNTAPSNEDIESELRTNAQKLMETLASFNVKIKKIEYSRGPTITRYELYPEAGTRIRTISGLVDDIGLSLATMGVRIEAPIPNKSAVGVEVPNHTRATVFIRELLESETFRNSKSKLTACLGKDVAGNMIIFDVAKMPHLLIAGTTGSGKSVCINCIIISLLYKARPDELQLIMIDPKKIEMSMYSDLPHLKVPVVTDTKRATGTLNAAVNEMEHRFELFEEVGVRDIDGYNKITAGDPERPRLPKIVIIIDELADLMMTAPDQIETSICRLAQKARAAGIHLIIGTQRPSVDVITGLIKANVPSRIAFTVASQVDSRTIIDIAGAEKLIGKGDMLYAPIGSLKPRRAQGALVADDEVEAVTGFIKDNYGCADYDGDFISDIDREAERVALGKKGAASMGVDSGSASGVDSQFRQALKIAVDNGTIATSYLQRKLSIGYGRAAKLIDQMESMGFVSGMNGTKPRQVLLTLSQYAELEERGDTRLDGIIPQGDEG